LRIPQVCAFRQPGGKQIERSVISSFQIAESMGFKGDFPQLGAPEGNGFPLTDHHAARL
jgi:hypothetical protein